MGTCILTPDPFYKETVLPSGLSTEKTTTAVIKHKGLQEGNQCRGTTENLIKALLSMKSVKEMRAHLKVRRTEGDMWKGMRVRIQMSTSTAEVGSGGQLPHGDEGGLLQGLVGPTWSVSAEKINPFMSNKCHLECGRLEKPHLQGDVCFPKPRHRQSCTQGKAPAFTDTETEAQGGKWPNTNPWQVT